MRRIALIIVAGLVGLAPTLSSALGTPAPAVDAEAHAMAPFDADERWDPTVAFVDPVVTGPVSAAFRARQKALGCDEARWPHVPADCFPDRR